MCRLMGLGVVVLTLPFILGCPDRWGLRHDPDCTWWFWAEWDNKGEGPGGARDCDKINDTVVVGVVVPKGVEVQDALLEKKTGDGPWAEVPLAGQVTCDEQETAIQQKLQSDGHFKPAQHDLEFFETQDDLCIGGGDSIRFSFQLQPPQEKVVFAVGGETVTILEEECAADCQSNGLPVEPCDSIRTTVLQYGDVPAVSGWGLAVMVVLLLAGGWAVLARARRVAKT
jgi:hypothetical protein